MKIKGLYSCIFISVYLRLGCGLKIYQKSLHPKQLFKVNKNAIIHELLLNFKELLVSL